MGRVGDMESCYMPSREGGSPTLVLMGRTGNGKSATGNSILGRKAFVSRSFMSSVTRTSECQTTMINGEMANVIDTPGLFDSSVKPEFIIKEIVKCIDLAKDGIYAILLVVSLRARFTEEETAAIESLQAIFGPKITDYMIVVFTGGDYLEENQSLEEFISDNPLPSLKKVLDVCENRMILFDNKTKDKWKKKTQLLDLLSLVGEVMEENDGTPYTNALFLEMKEAARRHVKEKEELNASIGLTEEEITVLKRELQKSYEEQLEQMREMVESKLRETNEKLEEQLAHEREALMLVMRKAEEEKRVAEQKMEKMSMNLAEAEKSAKEVNRLWEDKMNKMREEMEQHAKRMAIDALNKCTIL